MKKKHLVLMFLVIYGFLFNLSCNDTPGSMKDEQLQRTTDPDPGKSRNSAAPPEITFEEKDLIFDLGTIEQMQKVEKTIAFQNIGKGPLRIENVQTTCGCTVASFSKDDISPGSSGKIEVVIATGMRRGEFSKKVIIQTNDPNNKEVTVSFRAEIRVIFGVEHSVITFGQIPQRDTSKVLYNQIIAQEQTGLTIKRLDSDDDRVIVELAPPAEGYTLPRIKVRLREGLKKGMVKAKITLLSDLKEKNSAEFSVHAFIVGDIVVSPPELYFHISEQRKHPHNKLIIYKPGQPSLQITGFRLGPAKEFIDDDSLITPNVEVISRDNQNELDLDIRSPDAAGRTIIITTFSGELEKGQMNIGKIILETNDPDEPELEVIYRALFML